MHYAKLLFIILVLSFSHPAFAIDSSEGITTEAQRERFADIIEELRCLVCQNQSLADSDASLASDLRREIVTLMNEGKNDEEIIGFLVERYGDFILYRPPFKASTYALWIAPLIIFLFGVIVMMIIIYRQRLKRVGGTSEMLLPDEAEKLASILKNKSEEK